MATTYNQAGLTYDQINTTYGGFPTVTEGDAVQLYNDVGTQIAELTDIVDLTFKDTLNEETGWSFSYPVAGQNFAQLFSNKDLFFGAPIPGGGTYWGLIEESATEIVDPQEGAMAQFSGRGTEGLLEYGKVNPPNHTGAATYPFVSTLVGPILRTLIQQCKARGCFPLINFKFTDTLDSAGQIWNFTDITLEIAAGTSILDVLKGLADRGMMDWRMKGFELQVYNPNTTMAQDRTNVIFRRGTHILKSPKQLSRKDLGNALIGVGDDDVWSTLQDNTSIAAYGRKEQYYSFSGAKDASLIDNFLGSKLFVSKQPREANVATVRYDTYIPFSDFRAGDFVYVDLDDTGVKQYRIRDFSYTAKPEPGGEMALNDRFDELEIRFQDRIDNILGGASSGSGPVTGGTASEKGTPQQVTGVTLSSVLYQTNDTESQFWAGVNISWSAVTLNTDNTASDLELYEVQRRYSGQTAWVLSRVTDTQLFVDGLVPGKTVEVRVRAMSRNGVFGAYSNIASVALNSDTTPPEVPSTPSVDQWLGTLIIQWDGLDWAGNDMAQDFKEVRIYIAPFDNAPAFASTMAGVFVRGGGYLVVNNLTYDQPWYVRFTSVDTSGNESTESEIGSATPVRISGPDLQANSITANELAVGSVTAGAIDVGSVNANNALFGATANMIPDPAFGDAAYRTKRLTFAQNPSRWQFSNFSPLVTGGGYYLEALGNATDATTGFFPLTGYFGIHAGEKYYFKTMWRRFSANVGSGFRIGLELLDANGVSSYLTDKFVLPSPGWAKYETSLRIPDGYQVARVVILTTEHTSGSIFFDEIECRNFIGGVNSIGSRVEISALGIFMWDGSDMQTISVDAQTGDVAIRGQFLSGPISKRLVINPTTTYLPEIRFYPTASDSYAYINAVDGGGGATPFIGVNAPDAGGPPLRGFKLILTDTAMYLGEMQINTLTSTGTTIVGDQGDGYLYLVGKFPGAALNTRAMLMGGRFTIVNGAGTAGGTTSTAISKPTLSGLAMPIFSLHRGTTSFFRYHIDAHSTGSWSVRWENHPTLDNVSTWIHWMLFRGDDL